jgi:hypothetical protein
MASLPITFLQWLKEGDGINYKTHIFIVNGFKAIQELQTNSI